MLAISCKMQLLYYRVCWSVLKVWLFEGWFILPVCRQSSRVCTRETLKCFVKFAINQSCEVCGKRADFFIRTSLAHLYPSVRGSDLNRPDWILRRKIGLASWKSVIGVSSGQGEDRTISLDSQRHLLGGLLWILLPQAHASCLTPEIWI